MEPVHDVAVIGGGVVGISILYELTLRGYRCVLLEKSKHLAAAASSGNSGIIHSGFDAAPGTKEFDLIVKSNARMQTFLQKHNIPIRRTGAMMIAHTVEELKKLQSLHESVSRSSVTETKFLSQQEIQNLEPNLCETVIGGLLIPQEAVIDSCLYVISLAHHAIKNGAQVLTSHEVVSTQKSHTDTWQINTSQKPVFCKLVINAAGLYGDQVNQIGLGASPFSIKPRQGDFVVYGKEAGNLVRHIILPLPTTKTKGVIVYPSVYGNLVIGPTAMETGARENPVTDTQTAESLKLYGQKIVPTLTRYQKFETYAGIRPATEYKDYQISTDINKSWITVGGIRSTGLTASLGIASLIADTVEKDFKSITPADRGRMRDDTPSQWQADQTDYWLDGKKYAITHKLMRIGLQKNSKL